ncbi:MAG: DUF2789 domain-containing protein [Gammaproteobacteria bacterium]|nr:DUF2789 domain-containing protein [Gammaproteobacteria bacterium]
MDTTEHTLATLFEQLGLDGDADAIEAFIETHRPLHPEQRLVDAPFWNDAQRAFLAEAIIDDSDWAERVDELDVLLR